MIISEIEIILIKPNGGLVAFGSLVIDGNIYLSSIGIFKKLNGAGYRLTYPTKNVGGREMNIFHPVNKDASRKIEEALFNKLEKLFRY